MAPAEEKPFAIDVGQMIGVHDAKFGLAPARLSIGQFQLAALRGGLGQGVEIFQVQDRLGAGAEGDGLLPVGQVEGNGVGEGGGHFSEGAQEGALEGGAAVLLKGFFGDEEGEQLAFGDLEGGEGADFLCVKIPVAGGAVLERQLEPIAHEFQIAMNGLGADLQFAGESDRVGVFASLDGLVDAQHPLHRGPGKEVLFRGRYQVKLFLTATRRWSCAS